MSTNPSNLQTYDCLVLSGGGAKGAYGAGVAKALWEYRKLKNVDTKLCLVGTSAGALNAAVLATAEADNLVSFWTTATNKQVLGVWFDHPLIRGLVVAALRKIRNRSAPYSIFPNKGLRRLVMKCVTYAGNSHPRPLILAATNYTTAKLAGFYSSPLVEKLKEYDLGLPPEDRRLQHLKSINGADDFFDALLASSAIPMAFPPIKIGDSLYIDGGIGNNTPTREAAYFLRRLAQTKLGVPGEVFCVTQDTARSLIGIRAAAGPTAIVRRTWDVYHTVHTRPIIDTWCKINSDVNKQLEKLSEVKEAISKMTAEAPVLQEIQQLIDRKLQPKQQNLSITFIEPSTELGETLDFRTEEIKKNIERGYTDFVKTMCDARRLTDQERTTLNSLRIFPA
jgi:predicted acylesterase/phospholipase RssA